MSASTSTNTISFLKGGGEMGHLTRTYDWAQTPLGPPHTWPQSLRTTLGIMLHSAFPMFLFWGDELTCFYNDAYRPSLGNAGKHPAVGQPGKAVWPEIWDFIGPHIERVMTTGEPVFFEDQLVPIYRNGRLEDVYWTFSYSPAFDDDGQISGVFVTCTETTNNVVNTRKLTESNDQLFFAIDATELGTWDYNPTINKFTGNDRLKDWFGLPPEQEIDLSLATMVMAEKDRQRVTAAIEHALDYNSGGWYDTEYTIVHPVTKNERIVRAKGRAWFGDDKTAYRFNGTLQDITGQKWAEKALRASEQRFQAAVAAVQGILWTNNAIGEMEGEQPGWAALTGQGYEDYQGYGWTNAIHPDDAQPTVNAWQTALAQRSTFVFEHRVRVKTGHWELFSIRAIPLMNPDGSIREWVGVHTNIDKQRQAEDAVRASEAKLRSVVETAPVAIGLFMGRDLVIELPNQTFIDIVGKGPDIMGKPLREVMPELLTENQPFLQILDDVFTSGKPFQSYGSMVQIVQQGVMTHNYYNITYTPLFNEAGQVYAILDIAVDVTGQIRGQQELAESEAHLELLRDTVPAMIFYLDAEQRYQSYNQVFRDWFNVDATEVIGKTVRDFIGEEAYQTTQFHLAKAYSGQQAKYELYAPSRMNADRWLNIVYTPHKTEKGEVLGVIVHATDITPGKLTELELRHSEERFRSLIEEAPVATYLLVGPELILELANKPMLAALGKGPAILGKPFAEALPELESQGFVRQLKQVYTTGDLYEAKAARADLLVDGVLKTSYYDYTYKPLRDTKGDVYAIMCMAVDVTQQVVARQQIEESETKLRSLISNAPAAIALFTGRDLVIDLPNQTFIDVVGKGSDIAGRPLREVMPELESQPFLQLLDKVYTSGEQFQSFGSEIKVMQQGEIVSVYYNLTYTPLFNEAGDVYAILNIGVDVANQIRAQQALQQSEHNLRSMVESAPFPIGVYTGQEMRIALANQTILDVWGKGNDVVGKLYAEILPELDNQRIFDQLDGVYTTGIPFHAKNQRVDLVVDGRLQPYYFNYSFTPLFDAAGQVYGVMNTAAEITDLVLAKQQVEEAEAGLRGAVELAQLGTWSIDVATNGLTYSDRLIDWFGYDPGAQPYSEVIPILQKEDRERVETAVAWALNPASNGVYNEIYTVIHPKTGKKRILHAQGKTVFDANGKAVRMNGTAQDITIQRELQLALENEVQLQTRQLQASVLDLERSNHNLQQFAYIASHDLQEPLRKIQSFGDMLKSQYGSQLGEGVDFLQRMQTAASRMSGLIKDLLAFSRISTRQEVSTVVSLEEVVNMVLNDLELVVQETGAVVEIGPLPTVKGDPSQLSQLFQNLLSNALKFRQTDPSGALMVPHIRVTTKKVSETDLPPSVKPIRETAAYYCIDVVDDGIGFDQQYAERIFQVFQRLHGRNEFAGTGIGLAICEKVVANHGGAIAAVSQSGRGATFSVYLPVT